MSSRDDIKLNSIEKLNLVKQRRILLDSVALNSKAIANALSTLKIPALDGIHSRYVKALNESITNINSVGISSSLASSFQQSINSAALSSSAMASALSTLKIPALDGIHSRYVKALNGSITNIDSVGISSSLASSFQQSINSAALSSSAMASALSTLKIPALDGIHSRYVKALNESITNITSAGISSTLASSFQQISDCMNNIKIKDIRINNDGTINYYGRDINIDETIEEFDSILEEDSSIERKIHEKSDSSNPIMIIMLFLFFIIPITNVFNQSGNILKDNNINYEINESIDKLNENIVYKLDKVADILEYILIYGEKTIDYCENFYKEYPLRSNLIIFLISEVYQFIKRK
ncbi:Uncharacterised protein [Clostridium tetani]|uniref:hypothetical protein n=1 Tax=Clostridium tetani TaxID=1513 RepID=UPI000E15F5E8|nr:hypothetical protein [Clostridium tetani]SUY80086.1 Uncharacterised protein [Clostridium tetani]